MGRIDWIGEGKFPLVLAPMAGVTDPVYRTICKELGADVMVTEFVSAEGILRAWDRNRRYTQVPTAHRPLGVQLFGADGERMGMAARRVLENDAPDFIDINFGCPVPKVVGKNGGAALLKDIPLLVSVARGVVQAVGDDVAVTAKIRLGWDDQSLYAVDICRALEDVGVQVISVHGRTRAQQYSGRADWDMIEECAQAVQIPVIGNGDIATAERVAEIKRNYSVAGVMIGRAAMTNPWIFVEIKYYLQHGVNMPPRTVQDAWHMMLHHSRLAVDSQHYGDTLRCMSHMRSRLINYLKGFPGAKELRARLVRVETVEDLERIATEYSNSARP